MRLIGIGWIVALIAVLMYLGRKWVGHLPGDLTYHRGNVTVLIPLGTGILLSLLVSIALAIINRR